MKLRELISSDVVNLDLEARDMVEALEAAARTVASDTDLESATLVKGLLDRERLGSTSVGSGFAIPHCKVDALDRLVLTLVRFREPVDFGAPDDQPIQFFFVVLSPPDQPAIHLQVLSQIARVLKRADLRTALLQVPDAESVVEAVGNALKAENL